MTKLFKNYILNIFIAIVFILSQIVNVHANHLSNNAQREDISIIEQAKKKVTHMATLYVPSLNHGAKNEATVEGRVEKVLEPLTLGTFGLSVLVGYGTSIVGMFLAWMIKGIVSLTKSRA
ncbi:hypothetical protein ME1_01153 [Bartonella vinsonii subsp. arupensis OK-94-513]|uniref:Uncharacterized protein n=2 Tax=Bartonella vinsonii subsp. arupensis TaxID=110578 RepID=J0QPB5_BARVI|nr:hypothetical protein [Bartonella vinsonii]EJF87551.1 hypothetical protein ME1_01153 [Bartonella vinsonii subsp. arupensis OK-94-513]EJF98993.1 hypothetical protein MEI_00160 [Bartonella vinsonii subsp. arupensis Pm136co]